MSRTKTRTARDMAEQQRSAREAYEQRQEADGRRQRNLRLTDAEYAAVQALVSKLRTGSQKH
jgi:hypothetical protein